MRPQLSIEAFVSDVERLGLRLNATRLADGKIRLNRWRMPDTVGGRFLSLNGRICIQII
jgi:hypothetical protein